MFRTIALPTAFAVFATIPATPVAAEPAQLGGGGGVPDDGGDGDGDSDGGKGSGGDED